VGPASKPDKGSIGPTENAQVGLPGVRMRSWAVALLKPAGSLDRVVGTP
jgi:hypothetical protein